MADKKTTITIAADATQASAEFRKVGDSAEAAARRVDQAFLKEGGALGPTREGFDESRIQSVIQGKVRAMEQAADRARIMQQAQERMFGGAGPTGIKLGWDNLEGQYHLNRKELLSNLEEAAADAQSKYAGASSNALKEFWDRSEATAKEKARSSGQKSGEEHATGIIDGIKKKFGKGSTLGDINDLLFSAGGPILAVAGTARLIQGFAEGAANARNSMRDPNQNGADAAQAFAKSVPILGMINDAGASINEAFTGRQAGIEAMNRGLELTNHAMELQKHLAEDVAKQTRAAAEEIAKYAAQAKIVGMEGVPRSRAEMNESHRAELAAFNEQQEQAKSAIGDYDTQIGDLKTRMSELKASHDMVTQYDDAWRHPEKYTQEEFKAMVKPMDANRADASTYDTLSGQLKGLEKLRGQANQTTVEAPEKEKALRQKQAAEQAAFEKAINRQREEQSYESEKRIADARAKLQEDALRHSGAILDADLHAKGAAFMANIRDIGHSMMEQIRSDPGNALNILMQSGQAAGVAGKQWWQGANFATDDATKAFNRAARESATGSQADLLHMLGKDLEAQNLQLDAEHKGRVEDLSKQYSGDQLAKMLGLENSRYSGAKLSARLQDIMSEGATSGLANTSVAASGSASALAAINNVATATERAQVERLDKVAGIMEDVRKLLEDIKSQDVNVTVRTPSSN